MKITMRVKGSQGLIAQLRHAAGKVPKNARKHMHAEADRVVKEAKLNAPVDKHNLEESIQKEVSYEDRGRLKIDVTAGGEVNGVNVDQYATEMHENYESYTPGIGSQQKQAGQANIVGGKFLTRAVKEVRKSIKTRMEKEIAKDLPK